MPKAKDNWKCRAVPNCTFTGTLAEIKRHRTEAHATIQPAKAQTTIDALMARMSTLGEEMQRVKAELNERLAMLGLKWADAQASVVASAGLLRTTELSNGESHAHPASPHPPVKAVESKSAHLTP